MCQTEARVSPDTRAGESTMLPSLLISTLLPSVFGAVIEVTHGGDTSEPTYKFTDAVGSVTLTGSSSFDRITASGALASKDFVVSGVPPTSSELTIASCSSPDVFSGATCDRAYDGNSATKWKGLANIGIPRNP